VTANIVVINEDVEIRNFGVEASVALSPVLGPLARGSIVGTVTDLGFDDATVFAPVGSRIYTPMIDGFDEATGFLMEHPFSRSAGGPLFSSVVGPAAFGTPDALLATRNAESSIGIRLSFDLTPGDAASFTSIFEVVAAAGVSAGLDIKPGSCPNSFNPRSNGVLPVALVGSADFDVTQVDISTILIGRADGVGAAVAPRPGPQGPQARFEDAATPFGGDLCGCHTHKGDGVLDLSIKFDSRQVTAALELESLARGTLVELLLSGLLLDGTPFTGRDCIRLVPPH
jgi:hypothetical protein